MIYVERSEIGKIIRLSTVPDPGATEAKAVTDREIVEFLEESLEDNPVKALLSLSDSGFVRILDDLVDILIRKNLITFTEFPEKAQEKILERRKMREKISSQNLIVEDIL